MNESTALVFRKHASFYSVPTHQVMGGSIRTPAVAARRAAIRELRRTKPWSFQAIANEIGFTVSMVQRICNGMPKIPREGENPIPKFDDTTVMDIVNAACEKEGVTLDQIKDQGEGSRQYHVVEARRRVCRTVKISMPGVSSPQLGRIIDRDHATVLFYWGRTAYSKRCGVTPV